MGVCYPPARKNQAVLPARLRDRAGRDRPAPRLTRRGLQPKTASPLPGLSAPGGV